MLTPILTISFPLLCTQWVLIVCAVDHDQRRRDFVDVAMGCREIGRFRPLNYAMFRDSTGRFDEMG
jgi:hypothetical protein